MDGRKLLIKIRAETNSLETKNTTEQIKKTRSWYFEKTNKIDKPSAIFTKKTKKQKRLKIRHKTGEITDTTEIHRIVRDYEK